jgi:hypothetical protein
VEKSAVDSERRAVLEAMNGHGGGGVVGGGGGEEDGAGCARGAGNKERIVLMWGYLPGVSPQRSPLLGPVPVRLPLAAAAAGGDGWRDVCGGGCGFAMAISGDVLRPLPHCSCAGVLLLAVRWLGACAVVDLLGVSACKARVADYRKESLGLGFERNIWQTFANKWSVSLLNYEP